MIRSHRIAAALLATGLLAPVATAQDAPPQTISGRPDGSVIPPQPGAERREVRRPAYAAPAEPPSLADRYGRGSEGAYEGPLRHDPYAPDHRRSTFGFRNPGGVGRYAEYYPPGNRFQNGGHDPVVAAGFDGGTMKGAPTLDDQARAYAAGTARYSALQRHIDTYGSPLRFGIGVGLGAGFGYPY